MNILAQVVTTIFCPTCPWRIVPVGLNDGHCCLEVELIVITIIRKLLCVIYTYVTWFVWNNQVMILSTLSFLSSHASLYYIILAWERAICADVVNVDETIKMYREAQLLNRFYNDVHNMGQVIAVFIIMTIVGSSVSIFAVVALWNDMDEQGILVFGNGMAMGFNIVLITFRLAVKLYKESEHALRSKIYTAFILSRKEMCLVKRYKKSFTILKIYFSRANFFDRTTPLVLLNFIMNCTINLILLKEAKRK